MLPAVKEAEASLLKAGGDKEYLPIEGDPQFVAQASLLAMGENKANTLHVQTVGEGSALRVAGDLLYRLGGKEKFMFLILPGPITIRYLLQVVTKWKLTPILTGWLTSFYLTHG